MPRKLPGSLAPIVEDLELDQVNLVTMPVLHELVARHGVRTQPKVVASRLRALGWLLETGDRGVWEFAPAAHAGAIGRGEPTLPLQAALAAHPELEAALALSTAVWAHGYADRVPAHIDVAVPVGAHVPAGLARGAHVTRFTALLPLVNAKRVPTHQAATVVVHLAATPAVVRSWSGVLEWLPDLVADVDADSLSRELSNRPVAVRVRVGYLLSGMRPDLAAPLRAEAGAVVRFGARRDQPLRHQPTWRVLDSVLPSDPTTWPEITW